MTTTSIGSTGTVVTTGSTTYISSSASGLDTSSIIAADVATMTAPATVIDAQISTNTSKIAAYSDVQSLVSALSASVDLLASATNIPTGYSSAFAANQAVLTSSDPSVTPSNVMGVATTDAATAGSYDLTVTQLAKSMKVAGATMSGATALGDTGSFTLSAADGTAATINVTSGMTLSDVADAINAQSTTTGVDATLVQVSTGQFQMVLTSADTGQAITAQAVSGDDVLTGIGVTASNGSFANIIQPAQNAVITLDGTTITRSSNTLDDVIPGVTLNLDGVTTGSDTLNLAITPDTSGVTTAVNNFISAYNNLKDYLTSQQAVGADGTVASTAYLFADSTLRSLTAGLDGLVSGALGSADPSSSGAISYLSQLGITLDSSNDLQLTDSAALATALSSNGSALQGFFQSSYTTSDSSLLLMQNDSTNSLSFTLDVTANAGGVTGATVNGVGGLFTVSGDQLIGASGTPYAGLTFAITANSDVSIDVNLKQGLADSVAALASQYADPSKGRLQQEISSLTTVDTSLSAQAANIESTASSYQSNLITKYANMETEISSAKIVQQEIEAVLNGNSSSN
jgi:flagellar hook-associated protein 2